MWGVVDLPIPVARRSRKAIALWLGGLRRILTWMQEMIFMPLWGWLLVRFLFKLPVSKNPCRYAVVIMAQGDAKAFVSKAPHHALLDAPFRTAAIGAIVLIIQLLRSGEQNGCNSYYCL